MYSVEETEEIINFLPVITSFGRATHSRIQMQSVSIAESPNVNDNPGPLNEILLVYALFLKLLMLIMTM